MSVLTPKQCDAIFAVVERAAKKRGVRDVEVLIGAGREALTRFANNAIHQNVAEQSRHVSIRVLMDHRTARATTNRVDVDGLEEAVEQAIAITRCVEPDDELLPMFKGDDPTQAKRHFAATADCSPEDRARVVAEAIRIVEAESQTAAGIYSTEETIEALGNTSGARCFHAETMARFSITAMAADSSGWAKASSPDLAAFQPLELARSAGRKARESANPREVDAGRYTVILEPAAVLDLVGQMFGDFSATALTDQRSFLNDRLGEALFAPSIHINDDAYHPLQSGATFDGEGVPRKRLALVDGGVPREVAYSRPAARKAGVAPTGHGLPIPNEYGEIPVNIVMKGGESTLDQLIESTQRGILVTRLWYIREVDPYEKIMTSMTRDGTFLVENGEVVCGVRNFRFNQGLIELLRNVEAMTPEVRASGEEAFDMVVPALKAHEFNFTEVTRF